MKRAISNIAWKPEERHDAYAMMAQAGVEGLEIAPGLFFAACDDPFEPSDDHVADALSELKQAGLSLVSMQSLLFGVQGADLFGDAAAQTAFHTGMERAIGLAGRVGIPNLVFGSPKQRNIPEGMDTAQAFEHAAETFRVLGDAAQAAGTVLAIESNPAAYGTNFLNTLADAYRFVDMVDHPSVTVILDLGAMHMNAEWDSLGAQIATVAPHLSHVHVSEPFLVPAPAQSAQAAEVIRALDAIGYDRSVSIEMTRPEDGIAGLKTALARLLQGFEQARGE